jgi:UDP-4-amino-4,6-dideoxy-N-acetyl-beta-L-altrosamine transaminase
MPAASHPAFLPYGRQEVDESDLEAVAAVLRGDWLTTGPTVAAFEQALAARVGASHAAAVANGTAALHVACFAAGVAEGDRVAVPAITFLATANAARYLGAEPLFVDVDPDTGLMDLGACEELLRRERVRAVLPVHLTGRPLDLDRVAALAEQAGAVLIEDAAHALGARWQGRPVGSCGHGGLAILSFHPVKHITTAEGGAVVGNDPEIDRRCRVFRSHGMVSDPDHLLAASEGPWYYEQQVLGYNYRLTDLQCALGLSQLRRLDAFLARRRELAARYDALLAGLAWIRPIGRGDPRAESAWHLYAVHIDFAAIGLARGELMRRLRERGIGTQVHYIPVPWQPYYQARGWQPERFPGARRFYERVLSLPLFPAMRDGDPERVVEALLEAVRP